MKLELIRLFKQGHCTPQRALCVWKEGVKLYHKSRTKKGVAGDCGDVAIVVGVQFQRLQSNKKGKRAPDAR